MSAPARQVRFLDRATVNYYTPQSTNSGLSYADSPSSLSSASTLSSSPGPVTPPVLYPGHLPPPHVAYPPHGYEPFQVRPLAPPPSSLVPAQIHHLLSRSSGIMYDLTRPPESATTHDRYRLSSRTLMEAATYPPTRYLQISCPYLQWRIRVSATTSYVSVSDVLNALYLSLRKNVGPEEYRVISQNAQRRVKDAYENRYRRDPREYDREKRGGVKRVDFLMDRKWFRGLSMTSMPDVWQLEV